MKNLLINWFHLQRGRLAAEGFFSRLKALFNKCLRTLLKPIVEWLTQHPVMRKRAIQVVNLMGLYHWIKNAQSLPNSRKEIVLNERGKKIFSDLRGILTKLEES